MVWSIIYSKYDFPMCWTKWGPNYIEIAASCLSQNWWCHLNQTRWEQKFWLLSQTHSGHEDEGEKESIAVMSQLLFPQNIEHDLRSSWKSEGFSSQNWFLSSCVINLQVKDPLHRNDDSLQAWLFFKLFLWTFSACLLIYNPVYMSYLRNVFFFLI